MPDDINLQLSNVKKISEAIDSIEDFIKLNSGTFELINQIYNQSTSNYKLEIPPEQKKILLQFFKNEEFIKIKKFLKDLNGIYSNNSKVEWLKVLFLSNPLSSVEKMILENQNQVIDKSLGK